MIVRCLVEPMIYGGACCERGSFSNVLAFLIFREVLGEYAFVQHPFSPSGTVSIEGR